MKTKIGKWSFDDVMYLYFDVDQADGSHIPLAADKLDDCVRMGEKTTIGVYRLEAVVEAGYPPVVANTIKTVRKIKA